MLLNFNVHHTVTYHNTRLLVIDNNCRCRLRFSFSKCVWVCVCYLLSFTLMSYHKSLSSLFEGEVWPECHFEVDKFCNFITEADQVLSASVWLTLLLAHTFSCLQWMRVCAFSGKNFLSFTVFHFQFDSQTSCDWLVHLCLALICLMFFRFFCSCVWFLVIVKKLWLLINESYCCGWDSYQFEYYCHLQAKVNGWSSCS